MKIDIERLKTDRDYWDSVAPKGAESRINNLWVKWIDGAEMQMRLVCGSDCWVKATESWSLNDYQSMGCFFNIIQRPKPKEWSGCEVPPVGWHGEMTWGLKVTWAEVVVLPGGRIAVNNHGWDVWSLSDLEEAEFRPIRSERDKFIEAVLSMRGSDSVDSLAAAMFDAGFRLPEDKE